MRLADGKIIKIFSILSNKQTKKPHNRGFSTHHRKSCEIRVLFLFRERFILFKRFDNNFRTLLDAGLL